MLNVARRLAALVLGLSLVQLPAARASGACGVSLHEPEAHAMVRSDMAPEPGCDDCEPPADHAPCDGSQSMDCTAASACSTATAETNTARLTLNIRTGQLAGAPVRFPHSVHQVPDTPPPRA